MKECLITFKNEVYSFITGLDRTTLNKCVNKLKFMVPWRFHTPSYKLGKWDGAVRLFSDNGKVYSNLLPDIIPIIVEAGYNIKIEDERQFKDIKVPYVTTDMFAEHLWPKGHKMEGEPIMLRQDQADAANIFADNRYAIQELSTGYGKCLGYDTLIPIYVDDERTATGLGVPNNTKTNIKIGVLVDYFNPNDALYDEQEVEPKVYVYTPHGKKSKVNFVIKKRELGFKLTFSNGQSLICADKHILYFKGKPYTVMDLIEKHKKSIDTITGFLDIEKIEGYDRIPVYDIAIDRPHLYIDANGIIHHNTLLTAAVCKQVEHLGRTLTIVPSKSLVKQTYSSFKLVGMDASMYYSEEKDVDAHHVITTWQSLERLDSDKNKSPEARAILDNIKRDLIEIVVDECHGAKSKVLDKLLSNEFSNVPLRRGFTGTMPPEEYFAKTVIGNIGGIVHQVKAKDLQEQGSLSNCVIHGLVYDDKIKFGDYHEEYKYLVENYSRFERLQPVLDKIASTGNMLILVNRRTTGEYLNEILEDSIFIHGNTTMKERERVYGLAADNNNIKIIATYGIAAVGIDIPRLFNVVMVEPGKSFIRVIQTIGRGLRTAKDKDFVDVWDLSSTCKFSSKHYKERKRYYASAEYPYVDVVGKEHDMLTYIDERWDGTNGKK